MPPAPAELATGLTPEERLASLAEEVATLRAEVEALQDAFDLLRDQLGG